MYNRSTRNAGSPQRYAKPAGCSGRLDKTGLITLGQSQSKGPACCGGGASGSNIIATSNVNTLKIKQHIAEWRRMSPLIGPPCGEPSVARSLSPILYCPIACDTEASRHDSIKS